MDRWSCSVARTAAAEPGVFDSERVNPLLLVAAVAPSRSQIASQPANSFRQPRHVDDQRGVHIVCLDEYLPC